VKVGVNSTCNLIEGSPDDENLIGTIGDDCIYGFGGNDNLIGGNGDDKVYADNFTNPAGGTTLLRGDGGNDEVNGGTQVNFINGTNNTLKGIGEADKLIGGGAGSNNFFQLAGNCPNGDFYIGNGDFDYAEIKNFDINNDKIELSNIITSISSYNIIFSNGVSNLYYSGDLMAKIDSASALDINASYFSGQCGVR
jgi:RTX calcium-binding nonapeptide repeat (4 copies)